MHGGIRGGGTRRPANTLVAFLAGAAAAGAGVATANARRRRRRGQLDAGLTPKREQLHSMLANLSEAVTVTDGERRTRYANHLPRVAVT